MMEDVFVITMDNGTPVGVVPTYELAEACVRFSYALMEGQVSVVVDQCVPSEGRWVFMGPDGKLVRVHRVSFVLAPTQL